MELLYSPVTGIKDPFCSSYTPEEYRALWPKQKWLYNPFTGVERDYDDVHKDPYGHFLKEVIMEKNLDSGIAPTFGVFDKDKMCDIALPDRQMAQDHINCMIDEHPDVYEDGKPFKVVRLVPYAVIELAQSMLENAFLTGHAVSAEAAADLLAQFNEKVAAMELPLAGKKS